MHDSKNDPIGAASEIVEVRPGAAAAETNSSNSSGDGDSIPKALAIEPGKFAPAPKSFQAMTAGELSDLITKLNTQLGMQNMSFTRDRRALGQALDEMRTRIAAADGRLIIQVSEPAVTWDGYCTMIGVSRRSAFNWAENWKTISEAPQNLVEAAGRAGIDLFRPKTVAALKNITKQYSGRISSDAELSTPESALNADRICVDWQTVQRGTLQHEIFEGESAVAYIDGATVKLKVNCRADAGRLDEGLTPRIEPPHGRYPKAQARRRPSVEI